MILEACCITCYYWVVPGRHASVAALACLFSSFVVRLVSPFHLGTGGLHEHLWSWGIFLLSLFNPFKWVPFVGGGSKGAPGGSASSSALCPGTGSSSGVKTPELSAKLDASTLQLESGLRSLESEVKALRLELPDQLRALGAQGQASLNAAVEQLSLTEQAGQLVVVREVSRNITPTY